MTELHADEVTQSDRLHTIKVATEYKDRYQSVSTIRDVPPVWIDEPKSLGGFNSGPTALETTLAALNACSAMIMHIIRMELKMDLTGIRFETEGVVDSRRVEMKRTGLKYSQITPITEHYHSVSQKVFVKSTESAERFDLFRSEVLRLCPMHALLRDAGVEVTTEWIQES
jgi:putative redox protein